MAGNPHAAQRIPGPRRPLADWPARKISPIGMRGTPSNPGLVLLLQTAASLLLRCSVCK